MNKRKISYNELLGYMTSIGILLCALRPRIGAYFVLAEMAFMTISLTPSIKIKKSFSTIVGVYVLVFAVVLNLANTLMFQNDRGFLIYGYIFITLMVCFYPINERFISSLIRSLKGIAYFEVIGMTIQILIPSLYNKLLPIVLMGGSSDFSVESTYSSYAGFAREVSFTSVFLAIGIGIYVSEYVIALRNRETRGKIRNILKILLLFLFMLATGKRSQPFMVMTTFLLMLFINSRDKLKIIKWTTGVLGLVLVIRITLPFWGNIPSLSRYLELIQMISRGTSTIGLTNGRTVIYECAIQLWEKSKWLGIGWGNFKFSVPQSSWFYFFDVHNIYIQILCETGIIGAIIFGLIIIRLILKIVTTNIELRNKKSLNFNVLFASFYILFFLLYGISGNSLYEYSYYCLFFISIMILFSKQTSKGVQ